MLAKDYPPNELLLVTCGLPNARGYVCALDSFIWKILGGELKVGRVELNTKRLHGFALHLWDTLQTCWLHHDDAAPAPWHGVISRYSRSLRPTLPS